MSARGRLPLVAVTLWDDRVVWCRGHRDGLPVFVYGQAPRGLVTRRQLRARGLCPGGQEPVAVLRFAHRRPGRRMEWAALYRLDLARRSRPASPAQLVALGRAMTARRTCSECGQVKTYCVPTSTGRCWSCELPDLENPAGAGAADVDPAAGVAA